MSIEEQHKSQDAHTISLQGITVLLVEDDPFLSDILATSFSKSGCRIVSTKNGADALSLAEQHSPNVVILDLMLPDLNGEEILTLLKQHATLKNVPVIVFTNRSEESDRKKLLELGAAEYLVKASTNISSLSTLIHKLAASTSGTTA